MGGAATLEQVSRHAGLTTAFCQKLHIFYNSELLQ